MSADRPGGGKGNGAVPHAPEDGPTGLAERENALFKAAEAGDIAALAALARDGADVNAVEGQGRAPLHVAVFMRQTGAARVLIEAGADANAADAEGVTPLDMADHVGDDESVRMLLDAGARPPKGFRRKRRGRGRTDR